MFSLFIYRRQRNVKDKERVLKRVKRSECWFRCSICFSAIGQFPDLQIFARRRYFVTLSLLNLCYVLALPSSEFFSLLLFMI